MAYSGATLDVNTVLQRLQQSARDQGFNCKSLAEQSGMVLPIFTREASRADAPRVYISTGMHGDEPAGPLTILHLLEQEFFSREIDWTIFPMLNPAGFKLNQRENHKGIDLNRDYLNPETKEIKAQIDYIEDQKVWDLALILHEDWESEGFYLYDLPTKLTEGWAKTIVDKVATKCPIDLTPEIDEMSASDGIISPRLDSINREKKLQGSWPEAIYLYEKEKISGTYTFEAPSSYDIPTRVAALGTAIQTSVELLQSADSENISKSF